MIRILINGKNSQIGQSIKRIVDQNINAQSAGFDFIFVGRDELDLCFEDSINSYFDNNNFDIIVNCVAYNKVDEAEIEENQSNLINHIAVSKIAEISKNKKIKLIHFSTDFVFDGSMNKTYQENDICNPINEYGSSKLAGEQSVLSIMRFNAVIIRTSWLYSEYSNNFVDTIIKLIYDGNDLNVVSDQFGSPTYSEDLGEVVLKIIKNNEFNSVDFFSDVFHYSNSGYCSRYDFAKEIAKYLSTSSNIIPIKTKDYPSLAKRPAQVIMNTNKITRKFELKIELWEKSLEKCMNRITSAKLI